MKKKCDLGLYPPRWLKKNLLIMRITGILCLVCVMHLSAAVHSQTASINLKMKDATIEQVLNRISESTKMDFFYSNSEIDVSKRVNVNFADVSLEDALRMIFKGYDVKFEINDNFVVIHYVRPLAVGDTLKKIKVAGTVKDKDGVTLPGVTIQVKGTSLGFTTDIDGKFEFVLPQRDNLVLIFSFVGYQKQEIRLKKDNKPLCIVMKDDVAEIEEVVVTGIFNKPRESYTGAVSTITEKELKMFKGANMLQTLRNIDPAFNIVQNNTIGSDPNKLPEINLRGTSSMPKTVNELNQGVQAQLNAPLIIMDGFEISLQKLMDFNDEDIESVNILKDASATAIYGSRGANGVIVITTKAPQSGNLKLRINGGINLEIPDLTSYDVLNAAEKLDFEQKMGFYSSTNNEQNLRLQNMYNELLLDVQNGVDTYWLSKPLQVGVGQKYNLNLDGGSIMNCKKLLLRNSHRDSLQILNAYMLEIQ